MKFHVSSAILLMAYVSHTADASTCTDLCVAAEVTCEVACAIDIFDEPECGIACADASDACEAACSGSTNEAVGTAKDFDQTEFKHHLASIVEGALCNRTTHQPDLAEKLCKHLEKQQQN